MADGEVCGSVRADMAGVRTAFERNFTDGAEVGASFCATVGGETVADLWGGYADAARTRPWQPDTVVNVFSITKTMAALTALLIADRGELDFGAPVARYWPEFAAGGKDGITVAQVMSHSAGLSGWREPLRPEDLYDWERATAALAAQEPFWKPGTASGYHVVTQGFLIGEIVRRITGRTLGTVFREEIAGPLGADFHIGLPESGEPRVAELIPYAEEPFSGDVTELQDNAAHNPRIETSTVNSRAWRAAEIPAGGGTGNARSVAGVHAILANAGVAGGRRFLSEATCRRALEVQVEGPDLILGMSVRFGLGFAVGGDFMPGPNTLYWGGAGGSLAVIDLDARATYAYTMNKMGGGLGDLRAFAPISAAWDAVAGR
ncbi:serine hydrolase domain-containing protein [Pseudosporangium ferrugineum]|uniref:CubicO group peptidase (Beta-lactamase class C family) n=1 Tax=Pseudosporangium ferrugineum TaxID=439699 RepID=A0A2T0SJ00_9ACTN|nr:serine hydrolase domain-containing protein [Pseudosporangium ferrugineum]PRY33390.1 CubicO group peptidase (beta-lactamase class C family) [Pseudosporangium ferrugineum]